MIDMYTKRIIIIILLLCSHLYAQQDNIFIPNSFSIGFGYATNDLRYINNKAQLIFDYQSPFPSIILSSDKLFISLGYSRQKASGDDELYKTDVKILDCSIISGPNINLFSSFYNFPLNVYIPLRFNFRYDYVAFENPEYKELTPELHLLNSEIGLGIGMKIIPLRNLQYQLAFSMVSSIGGLFCFRKSSVDETNLTRSLDVNFNIIIPKLLSDNIGITLGYSYKMLRWTDDKPKNNKFIFQSITNVGSIQKRHGQNIFWLGINF
jgi:hypothetical protein